MIMQGLGKLFLKGLAVSIPVAVTAAILWWMGAGAERWLGQLLQTMLPDRWYVPGMGLVFGMCLVVLVGLLSHVLIFQKLFGWGEALLSRIPLVKSVYSALRDFTDYFSRRDRDQFSKVALVTLPGQSFRLLGFITRESMEGLPFREQVEGNVAVYLPMSYQVGGYTLYLSPDCVEPIDMPFEEAMRLSLTAGVGTGQRRPGGRRDFEASG